MAKFVFIAHDKPGALDLRVATRPAHRAFLDAHAAMIVLGGPILDEAGDMAGSLMILEAEDRAAVERFAAEDPYAKAGLFVSVEVRPWRLAVGGFA